MMVLEEIAAIAGALRKTGVLPPLRPSAPAIAALEQLARGTLVPDASWRRLLGGKGAGDAAARRGAAQLLVHLGVWDGHDDVDALTSPLCAPALSPPTPTALADEPTVDATDLPLVTIDGDDPHEVDDALFAAFDGDVLRCCVAIAAPACWIRPGTAADLDARARGATLYHPRYVVPMLAPSWGSAPFSLSAGERRPALLIRFHLSAEGNARLDGLELAWVRVREAWTYDAVDDALASGDAPAWLCAADEARQRSEAARVRQGAYLLYRTDVECRAPPHQAVQLRAAPQSSLARRIVSEAMVRAGMLVGAWLEERGVAAPFRVQSLARPPTLAPGVYVDPADVADVLAALGPARVDRRAGHHDGMAAAAYVRSARRCDATPIFSRSSRCSLPSPAAQRWTPAR